MPVKPELYHLDAAIHEHAAALLDEGNVEEALTLVASADDTPTFLWDKAADLLDKGEVSTVECFMDEVKNIFPNYYLSCGSKATNESPMLGVLVHTQRDLYVVYALRSALDENDATALLRLAYVFGRAGAAERLDTITDPLELGEFRSQKVREMYQRGVNAASQEAAAASST